MVAVTLAHFYVDAKGQHAPGDTIHVSADEARSLFRAGIARTETKGDEQAEAKAVKEARAGS